MMPSKAVTVLFALFAVFALPPAGAEPPPQRLQEVAERPPAPDFTLRDMDGVEHTLSGYRGKVVILNFWASWCPPCREEMPSMQRAWEEFRTEDVVMLAVNVGEDEDSIFEFTASYPVEFPLLLDSDSAVIGSWPVRGLPTTFIIDPQGRIVYRAIGGRDWSATGIMKKVRALK
ncbi:MAG: redoxin domain-containing protein [Thiogranum sp.]